MIVELRPATPVTIAVERDFGLWSIKVFRAGRFRRRDYFASAAAARREAARLVAAGKARWAGGVER